MDAGVATGLVTVGKGEADTEVTGRSDSGDDGLTIGEDFSCSTTGRTCGGGGTTVFTIMGRGCCLAACSNALANACTLAKRSFGSFARAVITTRSTSGN